MINTEVQLSLVQQIRGWLWLYVFARFARLRSGSEKSAGSVSHADVCAVQRPPTSDNRNPWYFTLRSAGAISSPRQDLIDHVIHVRHPTRKRNSTFDWCLRLSSTWYGMLPLSMKYLIEIVYVACGSVVMVDPNALRESITNIMFIAALVAGFAVSVSMEVGESDISAYATWEMETFLVRQHVD